MKDDFASEKLHVFGTKSYVLDCLESSGARIIAAAGPVPSHIAFCMDGNRRYAKKEHLNEGAGHIAGFETMLRMLLACYRIGVKSVTVYAFSIENFHRSPQESDALFNLVRTKLWGMVRNRDSAMRRLGWHIRFPGSRDMLAADIVERINEIEICTTDCKEMVVNICAPYTTRDDLAHALSVAVTKAPNDSGCYSAQVNLARYMAPSEPLDIFVRTSGETRFSDFMCWEATSQCTIEFVPQLWPEFSVWNLYKIIAKWQAQRVIKSGRRHPQPLTSLVSAPPRVSVSRKVHEHDSEHHHSAATIDQGGSAEGGSSRAVTTGSVITRTDLHSMSTPTTKLDHGNRREEGSTREPSSRAPDNPEQSVSVKPNFKASSLDSATGEALELQALSIFEEDEAKKEVQTEPESPLNPLPSGQQAGE